MTYIYINTHTLYLLLVNHHPNLLESGKVVVGFHFST